MASAILCFMSVWLVAIGSVRRSRLGLGLAVRLARIVVVVRRVSQRALQVCGPLVGATTPNLSTLSFVVACGREVVMVVPGSEMLRKHLGCAVHWLQSVCVSSFAGHAGAHAG